MTIYSKIAPLLSASQRSELLVLVALVFAMALLDMVGVAAILPFLAVLSNPTIIGTSGPLSLVYDTLGFETETGFLTFLGFAVFALVIVGIGVRALTFYLITRFNRRAVQHLAVSLLERYLARPYEWYLNRNSAETGKMILSEAAYVVNQVIAPAIRLAANALVALALVALLLYLEPVGAMVAAVFLSGAFALIYHFAGRWLSRVGEDRLRATEERMRITQEAMLGIKVIKLRNLEGEILSRFRGPSNRIARHQATIHLISDLPHYAMEAVCFGGMLVFVLWLVGSGGSLEAALPVIGAFAFAALRLMPLVQTIFRDAASVHAHGASVDALLADMDGSRAPATPASSGPVPRLPLRERLELDGVSYRYPDAGRRALRDVSLTIERFSSVGFVGSTGAGKTTVIDIVLGLLTPHAGRLSVDGAVIDDTNRRAWQQSIGYVPQAIHLADDTIAANIAFGVDAALVDHGQVERVARMACLHEHVETLQAGYQTRVGEGGVKLSGGQRQRIGIARALYHEPDLVFFDEATSALDTVTERSVMEALGTLRGTKTVIVVTHRLAAVRGCDKIIVMKDGAIAAQGAFDELSSASEEFQELLAAA